jgi:hypothetical protein
MAVKIQVKKSVRIKGPRLDNGALTRIGTVMVSSVKERIAKGVDADGRAALPISKGYAIFKSRTLKRTRGIGTNRPLRDLSLTGKSLQNYSLRRAVDNVIRADATTREARFKLDRAQYQVRKKKGVEVRTGFSQMFGFEGRTVQSVLTATKAEYGIYVKRAVIPIG